MLRRMRRRLIMGAMTAVSVGIILIVSVLNFWNYSATIMRQDQTITEIWREDQGREPERKKEPKPFFALKSREGNEDTTRFFIVKTDEYGEIVRVSMDYIASVTEEEAGEYGIQVLDSGRESGFCDEYRYHVFHDETGDTVVFLNVAPELRFMQALLLISCHVSLLSLFIVFVLIVIFSRRAIEPYMKNAERQKRFITDAGHELKTPLTSISTSVDILELEHGSDEWTDNIRRQIGRMTNLTENLVMLSRLDEELPFPDKQCFCLSDAVRETAEPFETLAKAQGKGYSQKIDEDLFMEGDRATIQQMVSILLDNAMKYSNPDGEICLEVYQKYKKRYIEVSNTCELEDTANLDRLFDRFYRPDASRSRHTGGSGIGLSIARAVAEQHGGTIRAESADGKRIRFVVVL